MKFRSHQRPLPELNLTPLIDVVFLLLIFFMVSTTFTRETQVEIELPTADTARAVVEQRLVEVSIDRDGRYYVNDNPLLEGDKPTLLSALSGLVPEGGRDKVPFLIRADGQVPYQAVVTLMEVAGELGFVKMRVITQASSTE